MDESLRSKISLFQPFVFSAENEIVFARVRKVRERERKERDVFAVMAISKDGISLTELRVANLFKRRGMLIRNTDNNDDDNDTNDDEDADGQ